MAGRLTPMGKFAKWIVAPAALGAVGYLVVGPRLGSDPKMRQRIREIRQGTLNVVAPPLTGPAANEDPPPPSDDDDPGPSSRRQGPGVEVETRRAISPGQIATGSVGEETDRPRRRRRRRPQKPPNAQPSSPRPAAPNPSPDGTSYSQGATRIEDPPTP